MGCDHPIQAEYVYATDVEVLEFADAGGTPVLRVAFPCPECGDVLESELPIREVQPSSLELPLDDAEDCYD